MPDWLVYTLIGGFVVVGLFFIVLIWRKKITIGSIELTWPPKITLVPSNGGTSPDEDVFVADGKSTLGKIHVDGAANRTSVTAKGESQIGDVTIKRTPKP